MKHTVETIQKVCFESNSMADAARKLEINYKTFRKYTQELGLFEPNQPGKGLNKKGNGTKIPLCEILDGLHPTYQTNKLRIRLIKEGVKKSECEICGIDEWLSNKISLELDHIDGNKNNHLLDNLRIVCPNCHSQTQTYRGKNIGAKHQK